MKLFISDLHEIQIQLKEKFSLVALLVDWLAIIKALKEKSLRLSTKKHEKHEKRDKH